MGKKVLLGMSGGVDSSVAAILLKRQGYEVIGVTMKLLEERKEEDCYNDSHYMDAKKVCNYLELPHYTFNFIHDFEKYVIQDFICEYNKCRTPNPCIECNKYLKFGAMYQKAKELGCDYIATGHYAKVEYDEKYRKNVLKKSKNIKKDQSYVLYSVPSYLLDKILLPLGDFEDKAEIRQIARSYNLPVANKPDSQDICFIQNGNYKDFLEKNCYKKSIEGNIVNKQGKVIGKHTGLYKYTIGQRKGLGISSSVPLFVIGFNQIKNELIVGEESEVYQKEFIVSDINLLMMDKINVKMHVNVKTRYSANEVGATIIQDKDKIRVLLDDMQKALTPGQSAVFYDGDIVIGGGKIE